jgi:hypothetical protein
MPNDAKLGLICGVSIVTAIGIMFFRQDGALPSNPEATAAVGAARALPITPSPAPNRTLKVKPTSSADPANAPGASTTERQSEAPQADSASNQTNVANLRRGSGKPMSRQEGASKRIDSESQPAQNDEQ